MIAKVYSIVPSGYDGHLVEVEGDTNRGLPTFNIVGMANKTISEARERVRSGLANSGFDFPRQKVTINLAPAELVKDGSHLDLPIALAILVLSKQLLRSDVSDKIFVGELSLDGSLKPVRGVINIAESAKQQGYQEVIVPAENAEQAKLVSGIQVTGVSSLQELFFYLKGIQPPQTVKLKSSVHLSQKCVHSDSTPVTASVVKNTYSGVELEHIRGQALAKRALTIAVAGRHNILFYGPPGAGKTLLARATLSLLPPLSPTEQVAVTKIYALSNEYCAPQLTRPFRAPHHTASPAAIIGGGARSSPGEISLAHCGILFLDELPEFPRNVLEALRQPLEDRVVSITRARERVTYPADFMLIATMNPCPCGHFGSQDHPCTCTTSQLQAYRKRLSGPILDRIDLLISVANADSAELLPSDGQTTTPEKQNQNPSVQNPTSGTQSSSANPSSNVVKNTITEATARQAARFGDSGRFNSSLSAAEIANLAIQSQAQQLLNQANQTLKLSARTYFKVLKVARTIADLENADEIQSTHVAEALSFRQNPLV